MKQTVTVKVKDIKRIILQEFAKEKESRLAKDQTIGEKSVTFSPEWINDNIGPLIENPELGDVNVAKQKALDRLESQNMQPHTRRGHLKRITRARSTYQLYSSLINATFSATIGNLNPRKRD
jgi:hypothetical protein